MADSRTPDSFPADHAQGDPATGAPVTGEVALDAALDGAPDLPMERSLGRYRVRHRVGAGGFARVYRAYDAELELDVALKVLKPELAAEPETVERFRREASTAAKLRHPNVVTVLNVGRIDDAFDGAPAGTPYLVMDFLPSSLEKRLAERGSIPEAELARVGEDVARGLAYAHERGVVHRDVKPDNVLFAADGRAMVSDFGIARAVDARVSSVSRQVVLGTPSYFSPEQARGLPLDGRSDIYALGVTLYQAATGALPFGGDDWYDVMRQHVEATPPSPRERAPKLSPTFEAVLLRCLAKDPADRFQSASELADALSALRAHGAEAATVAVPAFSARRAKPSRTGRRVAGVLLGVTAAAAVGGWLYLSDGGATTRARLAPGALPRVDSSVVAAPGPDTALGGGFIDSMLAAPSVALLTIDAPPTAVVAVDGTTLPRSAWDGDSIKPGRHVIRASVRTLDGCPSAVDRQTIELAAGERRTVELRPTACGELTLDVRPARARYAITPKRGGPTREGTLPLAAPLVLPEGWYQVVVQASLCAQFGDSVRVTAGQPTRFPIRMFCD